MPKAQAHPGQIGFDFSAPAPAKGVGELAGLDRQISEVVGVILASDGRAREVIAAEMSVLLDDQISRAMLDAYSSMAREDHRVPFTRLMALVVVTNRQDLLRPILRKAGIGALIGDEVLTARLGQLQQMIAKAQAEVRELEKEMRELKNQAPHITEDGDQ